MSDLLAVFGPTDSDTDLIREIARLRPSRVTVLIEDVHSAWAYDESTVGVELRDRLARLMAAIERDTRATVTGLAGSREQLTGWRFDYQVSLGTPITIGSAHRLRPDRRTVAA